MTGDELQIAQFANTSFYQDWTSGQLAAHAAFCSIQHANPYYDDSYAVNSANLGPYGDAITQELIPEDRKAIPRHRPALGARYRRRLDRRLGSRSPRRFSIRMFFNGAYGDLS